MIEFRTRRIPNKLLLLGLLAGIGLAAWHFGFAGGGLAKLIIVVGLIGGPLIPITSAILSVLLYISVETRKAARSPQERVDNSRNFEVMGTPVVVLATVLSLITARFMQ